MAQCHLVPPSRCRTGLGRWVGIRNDYADGQANFRGDAHGCAGDENGANFPLAGWLRGNGLESVEAEGKRILNGRVYEVTLGVPRQAVFLLVNKQVL